MRVILALLVVGLVEPAVATTVIDFEDWTGGTGDQTAGDSGGFHFAFTFGSGNGTFSILPDAPHGDPSLSLHTASGALVMTKVGGGTFAVHTLDLQEGSLSPGTAHVTLTAQLAGRGVVAKESFSLDGLTSTYERFQPVGLSNVDWVLFEPRGDQGQILPFSVDNIVVPEPLGLSLILLALTVLRKRR